VTGVPTGFRDLDTLTGGWQGSDLIIIAGRPGSGKTAFALSLASNASLHRSKPTAVGIFSLEMSTQQLIMRLLCAEARVDAHAVRTGRLPDDDWKRLSLAAGRLARANMFIDDSASLGILELRAKARRLKAEHNIGLIIVDYLQLMQGPRTAENREKEISAISRSLKALAKELAIPVVALSQLSRAVEGRTDKRPILSDLRESGAIEQDADVVMFVHRPEMFVDPKSERAAEVQGRAEIIVGKQRNGPIDDVSLAFVHRYTRFENLALAAYESTLPAGPEEPPF
jgi:replicative DNA helicase